MIYAYTKVVEMVLPQDRLAARPKARERFARTSQFLTYLDTLTRTLVRSR